MPATADDPVDISVVIPAYHGAAMIAACLASVQRATEGRRAEIIVVDSSGDRCGTRRKDLPVWLVAVASCLFMAIPPGDAADVIDVAHAVEQAGPTIEPLP